MKSVTWHPALFLLLAAGCSVPEAPAATEPPVKEVAVRLAAVRREKIARPVHAAGRIGYAAEARLAFKVGGVVATMLVDEGARVRRGQLLARLDPREIDAQLSSAESARAKAERDLERARVLRREDVVPGEVLENATTAAEVARAGADAARFNRRFSEVRAPAAGVVLARLVEPGEVVGPGTPVLLVGAAGRGARPAARAGHAAEARGPGRVVRVGVADRDVVRLAVGDPATIRLDALPGHVLAGEVDEIAPAATPATGSFEVTVRITGVAPGEAAPKAAPGAPKAARGAPDAAPGEAAPKAAPGASKATPGAPDAAPGEAAPLDPARIAALAAGLVAEVAIAPRATAELFTVPLAALVEADGSRGRVFAPSADRRRAVARQVEIAFLAGDRVALSSGLEGVTEVVSEGAPYLDDDSVLVVSP